MFLLWKHIIFFINIASRIYEMGTAEYYQNKFRDHFKTFWLSLNTRGSCSHSRAHQRRDFWGNRIGSALTQVLNEEGEYFSVGDLLAHPDKGLPDHLLDIQKEDHIDFLCALFYTILIDQVMYSHHKEDYIAFKQLTLYPKMDRTIGYARTMMMANPYEVFGEDVLNSRRLNAGIVCERFWSWANFIVKDLRDFFDHNTVGTTTWSEVREVMLADSHCTWGIYGSVFRKKLIEDQEITP